MKTRREASLLIVFLTLLRSTWSSVVYKGRLNGESCQVFSDCGHSAQSFLFCEKKICQCTNFQYYQEVDKMCVSYVGERCEIEEPTDGLPMVTCGENSECRPMRHDRFGRCHCVTGYVKNFARKCVSEKSPPPSSSSQRHHHQQHPNSILPDHPSHRHPGGSSSSSGHQDASSSSVKRGGGGDDAEGDKNNNNNDKQVISFPFYSANTNSKVNTHNNASSNVKSVSIHNSVLLFLVSTLLISFRLFLPNG